MHKPTPRNAPKWPALILLLLVLSSIGCATPSPPGPCACPAIPPAPAMSEPIPPASFSLNAAALIKTWRLRLTGSMPTE